MNSLNVRDRPNGTKIDRLRHGEIVDVYEAKDGWALISAKDSQWVSHKYLVSRLTSPKQNKRPSRGFTEISDGGRYGYSRSLKTLKSKCSYRNMASYLDGNLSNKQNEVACYQVGIILSKAPNHPYMENVKNYMNSSNWP